MPARSLRTIFSQVSASLPMCATSNLSIARLATWSSSLWQLTQYWSKTFACAAPTGAACAVRGAVPAAGAAAGREVPAD